MHKQEILEEINKTKEHLANMEKMLAECEYGGWKPVYNQKYYSVNVFGEVPESTWRGTLIVQDRIETDLDFNIMCAGATYCLNNSFKTTAIQEIGEERLKKYLRGE